MSIKAILAGLAITGPILAATSESAAANPQLWQVEWKATNFDKHSVPFEEILSGGPPKDGIPSIDDPSFTSAENAKLGIAPTVPVITFSHNGDARAYPLGILMAHEIVNDTVGGKPVVITYCPLCNAAIVFDAMVDGKVLEFGTTGKLRNSDLVMYDRTTESWWQQFLGEAIVGDMTGKRLKMLPSRIEGFGRFEARFPNGKVLLPAHPLMSGYGANPYVGYDSRREPYQFFRGRLPAGIPALARVVAVGQEAWSLELLRKERRITRGDLTITWEPGQNSALDTRDISEGREVGNVVVTRKTETGSVDIVHDIVFAFVFYAFRPNGTIHHAN